MPAVACGIKTDIKSKEKSKKKKEREKKEKQREKKRKNICGKVKSKKDKSV